MYYNRWGLQSQLEKLSGWSSSCGLGPGLRSVAKYARMASSVVSQSLPILVPQTLPCLTNNLRWLCDNPLVLAASANEISSPEGVLLAESDVLLGIFDDSLHAEYSVDKVQITCRLRNTNILQVLMASTGNFHIHPNDMAKLIE